MTYEQALHHKETVTGYTTVIDKHEHIFLVVPSKKEDFIKYVTDYFTNNINKTFSDDTAKEYSTDSNYTVTNFMLM